MQSAIGKWLKCHFGLPFLPPDLIHTAWTSLSLNRPIDESAACDDFSLYILNNYVSRKADQKCQTPTFPPELWAGEPTDPNNATDREVRTSNACESFHRYFNEIFHHTSPLFLTVIYELLLMQEKSYIIIDDPQTNISNTSYQQNLELRIDVYNKYCNFQQTEKTPQDIQDYLFDVASRVEIYEETKREIEMIPENVV